MAFKVGWAIAQPFYICTMDNSKERVFVLAVFCVWLFALLSALAYILLNLS